MALDARLAYDVWRLVIADEELYRATIAGTHHELAASRSLDAAQLEVLDALNTERGTRWNIENLRFRTALEVGDTLASYLPRTVRLLTNGDPNWLQDICFEYLAYYRWAALGHHRLAECQRFGTYARERIAKRRVMPAHFETVLDFELAVVGVLQSTAAMPPEGWPVPPTATDAELGSSTLRLSPAAAVIELPVDIQAWVESVDPSKGEVRPEPSTLLVYVPSLRDTHKIQRLAEGSKLVLQRFTGTSPTGAIADALAEEYGFDVDELYALVRRWLAMRVLTTAATASH